MARERVEKKENINLTVRKSVVVQPRRNFLKYYKVVRYWAEQKHKLNKHDLEMLYFLLDENLFTRTCFKRYDKIFEWDQNRFNRLLKADWIIVWRRGGEDKNRWTTYTLSLKAKGVIRSIYRKLNGEEDFSLDPLKNPVMKRDVGYVASTMQREMKYINAENRKERLTKVRMVREDIIE